eukprot:TRINITY_DN6019_c0_g1_i1.p1 TRINITY_DN6019_c0_g1~~TRINITY_DN6019_c0_g1_i1.p1  ORF type:complete len:219 (+),score=37.81 TRINITY_DN6019_c0_g1_i1:321-977(+)
MSSAAWAYGDDGIPESENPDSLWPVKTWEMYLFATVFVVSYLVSMMFFFSPICYHNAVFFLLLFLAGASSWCLHSQPSKEIARISYGLMFVIWFFAVGYVVYLSWIAYHYYQGSCTQEAHPNCLWFYDDMTKDGHAPFDVYVFWGLSVFELCSSTFLVVMYTLIYVVRRRRLNNNSNGANDQERVPFKDSFAVQNKVKVTLDSLGTSPDYVPGSGMDV